MGGYRLSRMGLYQMGKPEADALADETEEMVNIAVKEHGQCAYLYRSRGSKSPHLNIYVGARTALNTTALGKSMLPYMSNDKMDRVLADPLPATTSNSITDLERLREELKTVRDRGYAVDDEERLERLRCVAAPIRRGEEVLGAISVSAPTSRLKRSQLEQAIPDHVKSTANVIEFSTVHS